MLTNAENLILSELVKRLMQERTNPILVTDIAARIHETPEAEDIWMRHRSEYSGGSNGYRISSMINALPGIRLVGSLESGTGACYAMNASMPVTLRSDWLPWGTLFHPDVTQHDPSTTAQSSGGVPDALKKSTLSPAERDQVILFIRNIIEESGGRVLSSAAGERCLSDYRILPLRSRFPTFSSMLSLLAPEIVQQRDEGNGASFLIDSTHSNNAAPFTSAASSFAAVDGYPVEIDLESTQVQQAILKMHSFAFMGWWSNTSKNLRRLTGYNGNNQQVWCAVIALEWVKAQDSNKLIYHTTSVRRPDEPICIFNTGLTNVVGQDIYFILVENAVPDHQPWTLAEITVIGDEGSTFSSVLTDELNLQKKEPLLQPTHHIRLINTLHKLKEYHASILEVVRQMENGVILERNNIADIQKYLSDLLELRSSGLLMGLNPSDGEMTIDSLQHIVGDTPTIGYLESISSCMQKVLEKIAMVLRSILGISILDESYPTGKCKVFLDNAIEDIYTETNLTNYIDQYSFWIDKLTGIVDFLWYGNKSDIETISFEFQQNPAIMTFISDTLSRDSHDGDEVKVYLDQARITLDQLIQSQQTLESPIEEDMSETQIAREDIGLDANPSAFESSIAPDISPASQPQTHFAASEPNSTIGDDEWDDLLESVLSSPLVEPEATENEDADTEQPLPQTPEEQPEEIPDVAPNDEPAPKSDTILDQTLIDQCLSGEIEPEITFLSFGEWNLGSEWELKALSDDEQMSLRILTDPSMRTWSNMTVCICDALISGAPQIVGDLIYNAPRGISRELFSYLLYIQQILNQPENAENLFYKAAHHLEAILQTPGISGSAQLYVGLTILSSLPILVSHCLQIDAMRSLFSILMPDGQVNWTSLKEADTLVTALHDLLTAGNADPAFNDHLNVTSRLRSVINRENRTKAIRIIQKTGRTLGVLFEESNANYRNERTVLHSLSNKDRSPRTYFMLQSIIEGQKIGDVEPFQNDQEIMEYFDNLQESLFDARVDSITGAPRSHLFSRISELNTAYSDLLEIISENITTDDAQLQWFINLKSALQGIAKYASPLLNNVSCMPLRQYLGTLCNGELLLAAPSVSSFDPKLTFEYDDGETWPWLEEDKRIIALMEQSGIANDFETIKASQNGGSGELRAVNVIRTAKKLLDRCHEAAAHLDNLRWAGVIDDKEHKDLISSLSSNVGWLQHRISLLETGEMQADQGLPLVRHEVDIWYCERRIQACVERMAQIIADVVTKKLSETDAKIIMDELKKCTKALDVRGLMDRFSDYVTDITTLREEERTEDIFFSKKIYDAIYYSCRDEKWRTGSLSGIDAVSDAICNTLYMVPSPTSIENVKAIGSALKQFKKYSQNNYSELIENEHFQDIVGTMTRFFRFLGFSEPQVEVLSDNIWVSFAAQDRTICPLPDLARGIIINGNEGRKLRVRYRVQTVADFNHISSLLTTIQLDKRADYTILLCPFALSFEERQRLLLLSRQSESNHTFFLLDRCFIRFAMSLSERERIKAFYTCCTHLMRLFPYDVNTVSSAGSGVFFGRANEIERIMNAAGASVIYGGRRLGKTSIMRELEWRWLNQDENNLAVYLDLKNESNLRPEITLWYLIARNLSKQINGLIRYQIIPHDPGGQNVLSDAGNIIHLITEHLQTKGGKLLLLLDESDNLIYRDTVRYRERWEEGSRINELINLINRNENRVKVVMAGLDRVTRFVRNLNAYAMQIDPNWEVFQRFNNNIPLRPMLGSDMKNAFDLVDLPFKIMGYRLERSSIIYILRVSCFRPNLIQNYCSHLLASIYTDRSITFSPDSLYLHVPHEKVVSISEGSNGNAEFHQSQRDQSVRIPLNVGVTFVYAPVAYCIALMSFQDSIGGMFNGFTPQAILSEILAHNKNFADNTASALEYISTILNDLSTMGVLRSIQGEDGIRYALFSNYMLKMLGDKNHILTELDRTLKIYVERNSQTSEELREMYADRFSTDSSFSPMTIGQMESFCKIMEDDGCAVVVGSEMLLLDTLSLSLQQMHLMGAIHHIVEMTAEEFDSLDPDSIFSPNQDGVTPLLILHDDWTLKHFDAVYNLHQHNSDVLVVLLATPEFCWEQAEVLNAIPNQNIIHLTRLERSFRNSWLEHILESNQVNLGENVTDRLENVSRIAQHVGNWPRLAVDFGALLHAPEIGSLSEALNKFDDMVRSNAAAYWESMGMQAVSREVWDVIKECEQVNECLEYAEIVPIDRQSVLSTLIYLNHINVVDINIVQGRLVEDSIYRIDPYAIELGKVVFGE